METLSVILFCKASGPWGEDRRWAEFSIRAHTHENDGAALKSLLHNKEQSEIRPEIPLHNKEHSEIPESPLHNKEQSEIRPPNPLRNKGQSEIRP